MALVDHRVDLIAEGANLREAFSVAPAEGVPQNPFHIQRKSRAGNNDRGQFSPHDLRAERRWLC